MLVLGLSVVEIVRINMGRAKAAEAAAGAACDIEASYNSDLFERYHLLAFDTDCGGQGENGVERMVEDYLTYTLDGSDPITVQSVSFDEAQYILDDDCEDMKKQITDYMKIYTEAEAARELLEKLSAENESHTKSLSAIESGKSEEQEEGDDSRGQWAGRDPRDVLKDSMSGGVLQLVTPDGMAPSKAIVELANLQSSQTADDDDKQWTEIDFKDFDKFEQQVKKRQTSSDTDIKDNFYGISYALEFFDMYTDGGEGAMQCEVEYIICGRDNDYDNLKGVVNRIILHRLPVNFAYLMTDSAKVASVEPIAATLALLPGVTYPAAKYLLLGCWAYAETIVDVKCLLAGNDIKFIKSGDTWMTDIKNLSAMTELSATNYEGADAVGYKGYLAILLAENTGDMYYRMADLIQLNLSEYDENFMMKNMAYKIILSADFEQRKKYAHFIETSDGVLKIAEECYRYKCKIAAEY